VTKRKPTRAKGIGVSDEEYAARLAAQGGGCAIMNADYRCTVRALTRRYNVDHDHSTGAVRGLLCHGHNRKLWTNATPAELRALADYLERAS
jgi:hypothetical protein